MRAKGIIGERISITCYCGKDFLVVKSKAHITKYCNMQCRIRHFEDTHPNAIYGKSYHALHRWVWANKSHPSGCEHCGTVEGKRYWANKSHEYKKELDDWISLCNKCHKKHGLCENGHQRQDTKRFGFNIGGDRKKSKLTNSQVVEIFLSSEYQKILAEKYGVSNKLIWKIKHRRHFYNLTKDLVAPVVIPMYIKKR